LTQLINENQLDEWVRANARLAQGTIVELVWRLVAASVPQPTERRFPLGDSIGQHGPDGRLQTDVAFEPFVPEGLSFWEIGTGLDSGAKATSDYRTLTEATPEEVRRSATFIFVTPLSGRRDWEHSWKEEAQATWLKDRRQRQEWLDVRVIDGTKLIDWLAQIPSVTLWLAQHVLRLPTGGVETLESRWELIRSYGEPPPLIPRVFTSNRTEVAEKLDQVFSDTTVQLRIETRHPEQVPDFVAAYVAQLPDERRVEVLGRCLLVSDAATWSALVASTRRNILIADPPLDLTGPQGPRLIQAARKAGHAVIFPALPGGIPDPSAAALASARPEQLEEALVESGYGEERARTLVQKSGANLGSLLRCVQNLSLLPAWAERSTAGDLAIAAVLGEWSEETSGDIQVVETITGKAYGEWIRSIQDELVRPGAPLSYWSKQWKFVLRYEGWYALAPRLFEADLQAIASAASRALSWLDPQFDMEREKRFMASLEGKKRDFSPNLRRGLADALALMASHAEAASLVPNDRVQFLVDGAVRELLQSDDWRRWASLNQYLPLLAEASPVTFLRCFDRALEAETSPFPMLFAEEGDGFYGGSLISGVLWALETLAWDARYLSKALLALGGLASRDPGGQFANRPANSIVTILLPWLPQTTASVEQRVGGLKSLVREYPSVGWKALIKLLPNETHSSTGSRRPSWRDFIPQEWQRGVSEDEYWAQIRAYADFAVELAADSAERAMELVANVDSLPSPAFENFCRQLISLSSQLDSDTKAGVWAALEAVVAKHQKFAGAHWAMPKHRLAQIVEVVPHFAPPPREESYLRLFQSDMWSLLDDQGNYVEQVERLLQKRAKAVASIVEAEGLDQVIALARKARQVTDVGEALVRAGVELSGEALRAYLASEDEIASGVAAGYSWAKVRLAGWQWVDLAVSAQWSPDERARLLSLLPFSEEAWELVTRLLGDQEELYWRAAKAHFFVVGLTPELGIEKLLAYGRPWAAVRGIYTCLFESRTVDSRLAIRALLDAVKSSDVDESLAQYEIAKVIAFLQEAADVEPEDMTRVEWAYLPILCRESGKRPIFLERRIATVPSFFCELIGAIYKSTRDEATPPTAERESIATNAYRLLDTWKMVPGSQVVPFDAEAFVAWVASVRQQCEESGHLDVAMQSIGRVLVHSPADESGLWIHKAIAATLNERQNEQMRRGFELGTYNSRGVFWVDPTGNQERVLAEKYSRKAEDLEAAGYGRFAESLRNLADGYLAEAQRRRDEAQRE